MDYEKKTPLQLLGQIGWNLFLFICLISFCGGSLFLMSWGLQHMPLSPEVVVKLTPNATLVYSRKELISGSPTPGVTPEPDGGYPSAPLLNRRWMIWEGSHFVPLTNVKGQTQRRDGIFVYDFTTQQRKFLDQGSSILWFDTDILYYYRYDELYAYNLQTNREQLILKLNAYQMPSHPRFNGGHLFWTESYPAICRPEPTCQQQYTNVCRSELFSFDLQTKTRKSLGLLSRKTFVVEYPSATKLILFTEGSGLDCYLKGSPGSYAVLDIPSGKILPLGGRPYFGYANIFIQANGDIITHGYDGTDAKYTQLINFDGVHEPRSLFAIDKIGALGNAGLSVLLYAPGTEHVYGPRPALRALDIKTGWTQMLDEVDNIQSATGDSEHFAWTTYDGDLYVAPVHLAPAPNFAPLKASTTPMPPLTQEQIEPVK